MNKKHINNSPGPQVRAKRSNPVLLKLFLVSLLVLCGLWISTQYFASIFGYHASLGVNVSRVYAPWSILGWAAKWSTIYSNEFMKAGSAGMMATAAGMLLMMLSNAIRTNSLKSNAYLHGSARWAGKSDIVSSGLISKKPKEANQGVYVGAWEDKSGKIHYLRHDGPEHILTIAPTRSGKGVGLVVPTLLSWPHSTVITDLKGELWEMTSGWRKSVGHKVLRYEPASADCEVKLNPLEEIRLGTEHEIGDVQNLMTLVVDPEGKGLISHWQKTAYSLLVGVTIHALYKCKNEGKKATLPIVDSMLSDPDRDITELWMEMVTYGHVNGQNHPTAGRSARDQMSRAEEEAGSVLSSATSYLNLYRDPIVARNISESNFRIRDIMNNDSPVSLYIVTKPGDKQRLKPLVRVFIDMILRVLADDLKFSEGQPVKNYKHKLLLMMDEFPSLGKMEIMQESLAFLAGYGIKAYLICQDLNQLKSRENGYGPDEAITSNCHIQNAYPPNRLETADHLSRLTGQTTVIKEQITTSGKRSSTWMSNVSRTMQEVQRPLLTPDECLRMPGPKKDNDDKIVEAGDMIIYVSGYPAIYGRQPLYFQDPIFKERARVPAPRNSDILRPPLGSNTQQRISI